MSFNDWAMGVATLAVLKESERDGKVKSLVKSASELIEGFYPDRHQAIKESLVRYVILPFSKGLVGENSFKKVKEEV